jgi:hypothetical protein
MSTSLSQNGFRRQLGGMTALVRIDRAGLAA